jgi:hypothetical protein
MSGAFGLTGHFLFIGPRRDNAKADYLRSFFLGGVDGFDQDERGGEGDKGAEVSFGFLAAQGDAFEAFEFSDPPDAGTEQLGSVDNQDSHRV